VRGGGQRREEDLAGGAVEEFVVEGQTEVAELDLHDGFISAVVGSLVAVEVEATVSQGAVEISVPIALAGGEVKEERTEETPCAVVSSSRDNPRRPWGAGAWASWRPDRLLPRRPSGWHSSS
jgi:hypothetical protein